MRDLIGSLWGKRMQPGDWPTVVEALRSGAAYLSQGSAYSYLRARTLLAGPRLFADEAFGAAMQVCKWEGFGVAAQDLILILEADLRPGLPADPAARAPVLASLYRDVLAAEPLPDHRRATGWADLEHEFAGRLPVFLSRPPLRPDAISIATALRLLAHAPIDDDVREADKMMVVNNVAFRFIDYQAKLRREVDLAEFATVLAARMGRAA